MYPPGSKATNTPGSKARLWIVGDLFKLSFPVVNNNNNNNCNNNNDNNNNCNNNNNNEVKEKIRERERKKIRIKNVLFGLKKAKEEFSGNNRYANGHMEVRPHR